MFSWVSQIVMSSFIFTSLDSLAMGWSLHILCISIGRLAAVLCSRYGEQADWTTTLLHDSPGLEYVSSILTQAWLPSSHN